MAADFASLSNGIGSLQKEQLDALACSFDYIRSLLTEEERDDFGLELLDAARSNASAFQNVLGTWYMTAHLRTHPDYEFQKKEFENLVVSGELWQGIEIGQISHEGTTIEIVSTGDELSVDAQDQGADSPTVP